MKKFLYINSRDELFKLDISKVVFFEADGNYTHFMMSHGKLKGSVCMSLSQMQKLLSVSLKDDASDFARIGKRYIVNLNYVYQISVLNQKLVLSDGERFVFHLSVSKEALKELKEKYVKLISENTAK
jgi:DNA-binding LytR/AlgR family response regulator